MSFDSPRSSSTSSHSTSHQTALLDEPAPTVHAAPRAIESLSAEQPAASHTAAHPAPAAKPANVIVSVAGAPVQVAGTTFASMNLADPLQRALVEEKYTIPTPIQAATIPMIMGGRDVLGCAQTGTGKTAAFALPILHQLLADKSAAVHAGTGARKLPRVLVLSPTRELAVQIGDSFATYGRHTGLRHAVIYGGVSQFHQVNALRNGVDILVATPGRLIDLIEQRHVNLASVKIFVLDEADRMLDMGFIMPIRRISGLLTKDRQTLLFSATMPREVAHLADSLLRNPVKVAVTPVASAAPLIEQSVYMVDKRVKTALLRYLITHNDIQRGVVFTKTKHGADKVCRRLLRAGVSAEAIHGNRNQNQRQRALDKFKSGHTKILVATDVAARGLDVDNISHVFNFELPMEPEAYVHRIGRTGRAGAKGIAIAFCDPEERGLLKAVERLAGKQVTRVTEMPDLSAELAAEHAERAEAYGIDGGAMPPPRDQQRGGGGYGGGGYGEGRDSGGAKPRRMASGGKPKGAANGGFSSRFEAPARSAGPARPGNFRPQRTDGPAPVSQQAEGMGADDSFERRVMKEGFDIASVEPRPAQRPAFNGGGSRPYGQGGQNGGGGNYEMKPAFGQRPQFGSGGAPRSGGRFGNGPSGGQRPAFGGDRPAFGGGDRPAQRGPGGFNTRYNGGFPNGGQGAAGGGYMSNNYESSGFNSPRGGQGKPFGPARGKFTGPSTAGSSHGGPSKGGQQGGFGAAPQKTKVKSFNAWGKGASKGGSKGR